MAIGDAILEFKLTLDEVESNLNFLRASARLRPRLSPLLNWAHLAEDQNSKMLVQDFLRHKDIVLTPQYRGMIVVISGAFEQAVRRILEEAIIAFSSIEKGFDSLPETIRVQNVIRTGRALAKFQEPLDHAPLDHQSLVERLALCKPNAKEFCLNHEVFSCFVSSITPKHLEEIFGWIDTQLNWDDLGRNPAFEELLGTKGARATGKAVAEYLQKFTKLRNSIAHVGGGSLVVTENDIVDSLGFFRLFVDCVAELVAKRIKL